MDVRHWSMLAGLALLPCLAACDRSPDGQVDKGSAVGDQTADTAIVIPPDDPEVVKTIEATSGVVFEREGDNIVKLNLLALSPSDLESLKEEFAWARGLPALEQIIASGPGVNDEAMAQLAGHLNLSVLTFEKRSSVTDAGIELIKDLPNLTDISLERSEITDESLKHLSESKTILRIRAPRTKLTDAGVMHLVNAPQLQLLDVLECTGISDACLPAVGQLTNLRNFRAYGRQITNEGMPHLANLKNLAALGLQYANVNDEGLAQLSGLVNLKEVNLYGTYITDASVETLAGFPKLAKARLRDTSIRGQNAAGFAEMQAMRDLDLSESPVQDDAMAPIGKISGLQKLNLWNAEVTDAGVAELKGLTNLVDLNLENLWDITDESLEVVAGFPKLKTLNVGGTSVSDEGLPKLYGLKELRTLNLSGSEVSKAGYEALQQNMPWVTKIEF